MKKSSASNGQGLFGDRNAPFILRSTRNTHSLSVAAWSIDKQSKTQHRTLALLGLGAFSWAEWKPGTGLKWSKKWRFEPRPWPSFPQAPAHCVPQPGMQSWMCRSRQVYTTQRKCICKIANSFLFFNSTRFGCPFLIFTKTNVPKNWLRNTCLTFQWCISTTNSWHSTV